MKELLIVAVIAVVFVFGWFLMKRLDYFLKNNFQAQALEEMSGKDTLRIGLSNPLVSDSIANILEQYSQIYTNISVRIFYGAEDTLIKELVISKLDVVFLSGHVDIPTDVQYNVKKALLSYTPVIMKYGGLPIEPIADGNIVQNVLWLKKTRASFVNYFVECIEDGFTTAKK